MILRPEAAIGPTFLAQKGEGAEHLADRPPGSGRAVLPAQVFRLIIKLSSWSIILGAQLLDSTAWTVQHGLFCFLAVLRAFWDAIVETGVCLTGVFRRPLCCDDNKNTSRASRGGPCPLWMFMFSKTRFGRNVRAGT